MSDNMSINREIKRIEFFSKFGSELNLIHFRSRASFSGLFRSREIRPEFELKSVKNLIKSELNSKVLKNLKNSLILPERSSQTLPVIALSFWTTDKPEEEDKQRFRCLALELVSEMSSSEVLQFCHLLGKKRINSSKKLRKVFKDFYSKQLNEKDLETILVLSRDRDWSHRDVIRLCHVPPNDLTRALLSRESDNIVVKRVAILRSEKSKTHELVEALDKSLLPVELWSRALNPKHLKNPIIWLKMIKISRNDFLLKQIPRIVSRFPNNRRLFRQMVESARKSTEVSKILKTFVYFFLKNNKNPLQRSLATAVQLMTTRPTDGVKIHLIVDKNMEINEKFLSEKKRKKQDFLDRITKKDLIWLFFQGFDSHLITSDLKSLPFNEQNITGNEIQFPFETLPQELRQNLVFLTEEVPDINQWPSGTDKVIICLLNRTEVKNFGFFRENVLVLNGFDFFWEQIFCDFFRESVPPTDAIGDWDGSAVPVVPLTDDLNN